MKKILKKNETQWSSKKFLGIVGDPNSAIYRRFSLTTKKDLHKNQKELNKHGPSSGLAKNKKKKKKMKELKPSVFGQKLPNDFADVPECIIQAMTYIQKFGIHQEGIFREPPIQNEFDSFIKKIEENQPVDYFSCSTPHVAASIIKKYFRDLQEPLLTYDMYGMFIASSGIPDKEQRIERIKKVVQMLPEANYKILKHLCLFLHSISTQQKENKASPTVLGAIFCSNVLKSPCSDSLEEMIKQTNYAKDLMISLIEDAEYYFADELQEIPQQVEELKSVVFAGTMTNNIANQIDSSSGMIEAVEGDEEVLQILRKNEELENLSKQTEFLCDKDGHTKEDLSSNHIMFLAPNTDVVVSQSFFPYETQTLLESIDMNQLLQDEPVISNRDKRKTMRFQFQKDQDFSNLEDGYILEGYIAQMDDELSVEECETVKIIQTVDDWTEVRNESGKIGFIPSHCYMLIEKQE